ncbi:MAG: hypothetical protein J5695_03495 [Bacteroidales bacterium]|nr:hypothetical protein [Bacteroidales bacterium]MBO4566272.1 hypothetical protein [Bacteroidales bacterium]
MKKKYISPNAEAASTMLEYCFLQASLGPGSSGEDLDGSKNIYDFDW